MKQIGGEMTQMKEAGLKLVGKWSEKAGEEATCIHQQKLKTKAEMPKKLANVPRVKLSGMGILGIS